MVRAFSAALLAVAVVAPASFAQGPVQRAGQAIDNAGRKIRSGVEGAVARGQLTAQERDLLNRVTSRLSWDKQMVGSALQVEVRADGTAILRGSALDAAAKKRALDLVESTIGVTTVVDELAVVKDIKVIQARPATRVVEIPPATVEVPTETKVIVPADTKVIVKP